MPGLLLTLDVSLEGFDVEALFADVVGQLEGVSATVTSLRAGPGTVAELLAALDSPPVLPGLDGLGSFAGGVEGALALIPADTSGALGPMLTPLTQLGVTARAGISTAGVREAFEAIRELIRLATGRVISGAAPMPDEASGADEEPNPNLGLHLELPALHAAFDELEAALEGIVDRINPADLVGVLRRLGLASRDTHTRWPMVPIVADMLDAIDSLSEWEQLELPALSAFLAASLADTAKLIELPRVRVIEPVIAAADAAAEVAGDGPGSLAQLALSLGGVVDRLGVQQRAGAGLAPATVAELDAGLAALEAVTRTLDLASQDSRGPNPLTQVEGLGHRLELELLRVIRLLHPAIDKTKLEGRASELLAKIPVAEDEAFADLLSEVEALDLSAITDPLAAINQAIADAVAEVEAAREAVKDQLIALLTPVHDALAGLGAALGLEGISEALAALPAQLSAFVDAEVSGRLASLEAEVSGAVASLAAAVDGFDPSAIEAQLRGQIEALAAPLQSDEVQEVFAAIEAVLAEVLGALEGFAPNLSQAADESIALLDQVREAAASIDLSAVPDALLPVLRAAVDGLADLDIQAEVGVEIEGSIGAGLDGIIGPLLDEFEGSCAALRARLEAFRPSSLVGEALDRPFVEVLAAVEGFVPSDLLGRLGAAVDQLRQSVHMVAPEEVLAPLAAAHGSLVAALARLEPAQLLAPIEAAIEDAAAAVVDGSGLADAFDGVAELVAELDSWVDLLGRGAEVMAGFAARLDQPVALQAGLDALIQAAVERVGQVEFGGLAGPLAAAKIAAESGDARRLAARLAPSLRRAAAVPDALVAPSTQALIAKLRALPDAGLGSERGARALRLAEALAAATDPWHALAPRLEAQAGAVEVELRGYALLGVLEGRHVFADFLDPPTDIAGIQAQIEGALRESLELPGQVLEGLAAGLVPHAAGFARELGRLLAAIQAKVGAITGDAGLSGTMANLDEGLALIRGLDLAPISTALDQQIHAPLAAIVAQLDLASALDGPLRAANAALASVLDLGQVVDAQTLAQLDRSYAEAVAKLRTLTPGALLGPSLDPIYAELLAGVLPILDLPVALREALSGARTELSGQIVVELGRVELAFDALLRALPLQGGGGASISVSASASVGGGS